MTYLYSAILGLIQGVAEFLPISSSGHLALFQQLFNLKSAEETDVFFDVLLHLGTLISVFVYYWGDIWEMILEFFRFIRDLATGQHTDRVPPARRMILLMIVGTLPLFLILPIKSRIEALNNYPLAIGFALLVTGTLLFVSDRLAKGRKDERSATIVDCLLVGCGQALATVPGLSRSGTTIAVGLLRGYDRDFAVCYSFLLSLPAVIGANILSVGDAVEAGIDTSLLPIYAVGVVIAAVSGYFAIRLVNLLTDKGKFGGFAYYCWGVGLLAVLLAVAL
ncbi:MAG: undecaprenyl-diphosphate phosphatase [Clostridiales bacterium]|nr:undecaprenyl-diphosphate phosphatase [Clostridiales bacterium]